MSKPAMSQRSMSPPRAPRAAFDGFKGSFAEDVVGRRLRVSVIVPARNEELNLRDVLEAIPQSVSEIIVVDGHSTDDTLGVARRSPRRVLVLSQLSTGKADAVQAI